jgi:hypothetical protein
MERWARTVGHFQLKFFVALPVYLEILVASGAWCASRALLHRALRQRRERRHTLTSCSSLVCASAIVASLAALLLTPRVEEQVRRARRNVAARLPPPVTPARRRDARIIERPPLAAIYTSRRIGGVVSTCKRAHVVAHPDEIVESDIAAAAAPVAALITIKDVRGSESNCEQDSRKM